MGLASLGGRALGVALAVSLLTVAGARANGTTYVVGIYQRPNLRLYVDGRQVAEKKVSAVPGRARSAEIGSFLSGEIWNGVIDEVAVYDRALPADAIRAHFEAGLGRTPGRYADAVRVDLGIVSYWRLGERGGTGAADTAGISPGRYRAGSIRRAKGLIAGDADTALSLRGKTGGVLIPRLEPFTTATGVTLEAWVQARENRNATILSTTGSLFLKTNSTGQWGVGVVSTKRIEGVFSAERARGEPVRTATPRSRTSRPPEPSGGGIGVGTVLFALGVLASVAFAVRALFARVDDGDSSDRVRPG